MKYVTIKKFAELSGYTEKAVRGKIEKGVWLQGSHYRKAPDGRVMIACEAVERWVEGEVGLPVLTSRRVARRACTLTGKRMRTSEPE